MSPKVSSNKRRLYEFAAANDTPFPALYFPGTYDEALAVKDSLRYPAFIRMERKSS
jgi:hypothetical protein